MMGGLAYMTGPTGRPLRAGSSITDILGGSYGVIGILAALYQRQFTGRGQLVQATLYESVAFLVGQHMAITAITGQAPPPMPDRGRAWSIYDLFKTADGELVFIGVTSDRHWQRMCETFGFSDWFSDQRLSTNQGRIDQRDWFLPKLQSRLGKLEKAEMMALAEKAGIPFAAVAKPQDLFEDPQLNQSGSLAPTTLPGGGVTKLPKIPLRMEHSPFDLRLNPPGIGEGSMGLYKALGFSDAEIRDLAKEGVLELPREEWSAAG
jgi:crotonobetainyl-CoA:carnitine CoA-transferase CaiB-like acyl-CoA transferase